MPWGSRGTSGTRRPRATRRASPAYFPPSPYNLGFERICGDEIKNQCECEQQHQTAGPVREDEALGLSNFQVPASSHQMLNRPSSNRQPSRGARPSSRPFMLRPTTAQSRPDTSRPTTGQTRPWTAQTRPGTARPMTSASARPEGSYVIALLEGRGVVCEVGVAALDKETGRTMLVQMGREELQTVGRKPSHRGYHTANLIGNIMIVFGRSDGEDCFNDIWSDRTSSSSAGTTARATVTISFFLTLPRGTLGRAPSARGYHVTLLANSQLFLFGGFNGSTPFDEVHILDLAAAAYLPQVTPFDIRYGTGLSACRGGLWRAWGGGWGVGGGPRVGKGRRRRGATACSVCTPSCLGRKIADPALAQRARRMKGGSACVDPAALGRRAPSRVCVWCPARAASAPRRGGQVWRRGGGVRDVWRAGILYPYPNNIAWSAKISKLYWRGMTSGGWVYDDNYHAFPRFRLIDIGWTHTNLMNVRLSAFHDSLCGEHCDAEAIKAEYHITGASSPREESTVFAEYFNDRLRPFEHYIPILPDLSDLVEKLEWAVAHDAEAHTIQQAGEAFANRVITDAWMRPADGRVPFSVFASGRRALVLGNGTFRRCRGGGKRDVYNYIHYNQRLVTHNPRLVPLVGIPFFLAQPLVFWFFMPNFWTSCMRKYRDFMAKGEGNGLIISGSAVFAMPAPPTDLADELPPIDIDEASRTELIEALKSCQLDNTRLRAENRELKKENSDLMATVSKKRRGNDNALGYKSQVVGWAKKFLLLRGLFIDNRMFRAKPTISMDPATIFANDDLYSKALTVTLYEDIPTKFHSLLNGQEYAGLAKDFIREHGDGRSSLILTIRKALPAILKNPNIDADLLTTAGADRRDDPTLEKLLKFPNDRKPTLWAPVLFPGSTQDMTQIFTGPAVLKVHRVMFFGPSSLIEGRAPAPNSNGVRLGFQEVTAASISEAAILTRFVLSPDKEWASTGAVSGIDWEEQYKAYHKMLASNMHLPHVRAIFRSVQKFVFAGVKTSSPGTTGSDHDDTTEDDIVDAMRRFELGTDSIVDEDGGDVVVSDVIVDLAPADPPQELSGELEGVIPEVPLQPGGGRGRGRGHSTRTARETNQDAHDVDADGTTTGGTRRSRRVRT
ncbi:hypothetical protein DFH07DRAFT_763733 [Mycena maculata]|uniref:Glycosyl transferase CAP10 domain-containing protein n=1 Tax=Mycena maculata TaxID=230809 RepID=A0AAD7KI36_9AGAR|nr:hypothetical protein DFH07DRAFT_763733 [Mycena maculata]